MKLREAVKEDASFLFDLRNEENVRKISFKTSVIDFKSHITWFEGKLNDENSKILIAEENGKKMGQIRFDMDPTTKETEISLALNPEHRGRGNGTKMVTEGCEYAFKKFGSRKIVAHIKPENKTSIALFSKTRFVNTGETMYKTHRCIKMILEAKNNEI